MRRAAARSTNARTSDQFSKYAVSREVSFSYRDLTRTNSPPLIARADSLYIAPHPDLQRTEILWKHGGHFLRLLVIPSGHIYSVGFSH